MGQFFFFFFFGGGWPVADLSPAHRSQMARSPEHRGGGGGGGETLSEFLNPSSDQNNTAVTEQEMHSALDRKQHLDQIR